MNILSIFIEGFNSHVTLLFKEMYGFCDLCVNIDGVEGKWVTSVCKRLRLSGFKTVALNFTLGDEIFKTSKKKKGKQKDENIKDIIPEPMFNDIEEVDNLKILNRLTVHISDPSQLYQLKRSTNFSKYDLFAVVPLNQNIFQQVCGLYDIDIISFIPESKLPYRLSRKLYNMAVDKNMFFEIPYGPAIMDSTCRKNVISTSHQYFTMGKSKNVIITSSSTYPYNSIRGPYDIVHLGLILGLNDVLTKQTISKNCTELIYRSEVRRRKKSFFSSFKIISEVVSNEAEATTQEEANVEHPLKKIKLNDSNQMET